MERNTPIHRVCDLGRNGCGCGQRTSNRRSNEELDLSEPLSVLRGGQDRRADQRGTDTSSHRRDCSGNALVAACWCGERGCSWAAACYASGHRWRLPGERPGGVGRRSDIEAIWRHRRRAGADCRRQRRLLHYVLRIARRGLSWGERPLPPVPRSGTAGCSSGQWRLLSRGAGRGILARPSMRRGPGRVVWAGAAGPGGPNAPRGR